MSRTIEVRVPDMGDFDAVDVVEVLVEAGDSVDADDGLITLESDKASMEVPAPEAGTVREMQVGEGDSVSSDDLIAILEVAGEASDAVDDASGEAQNDSAADEAPAGENTTNSGPSSEAPRADTPSRPVDTSDADLAVDLVVLGSGPAGYTAAFRAADLGLKVALVERYESLGGVCLNVGCIPSKALLHVAALLDDAAHFGDHGVQFGAPTIDLDALRAWKDGVVRRLTGGLAQLAKQRKVEVVQGTGTFTSPWRLQVEHDGATRTLAFEQAIVAAGSRPVELPGLPYDDQRLIDSTGALELRDIPARLLVLGGGIIGLEMATVYHALGSEITVVELTDELMPGTDRDLVKPLQKRLAQRYDSILLGVKVVGIEPTDDGLRVSFEARDGGEAPEPRVFDRVLSSVGRRPNGDRIGADAAGLAVDERGFLTVDRQMRTNVGHIFAVGDIVGGPMLAHKGIHEGKVAAEVAAGERSSFDARVIPSVAYTDPEVAWVGVTEREAKEQGLNIGKGSFPWAASGRSLAMARDEGLTKVLFDEDTGKIVGAGIVGPHAGDLIAEATLAIEMGCDAHDIGLTIHPHPTLSETVGQSAEAFAGTLTDLYLPKKNRR
ncbi:MAG: dihydrolipoyl dehydrogenase [Acidobacteriota bacterium]